VARDGAGVEDRHVPGIEVDLRACEPADLPALEAWAPTGSNRTHEMRFSHQVAGTSTYLLAHPAGEPGTFVGSCELRWDGCAAAEIPRCPEVNGLQVWPARLQSRGIGTQILRRLDALVAARGHDTIGLGVDDPRARALYLRLGYVDSGLTYVDRYTWIDDDHRPHEVADRCAWLTKRLARPLP
jgi:GNAT superfamily N-acetyltransferase